MGSGLQTAKTFKGTTTVGVLCSDGVILAADKRAVSGYFISHKKTEKISIIKQYIAVTMAGTVAEAQILIDQLKGEANLFEMIYRRRMSVRALASLAAQNMGGQYRYSHYPIQLIVGGFDDEGPSLFAVDFLGALTEEKLIATGSGSPVALGELQGHQFEGMRVGEAIPVVRKAIEAAMEWDTATGEGVDIVAITKDGASKQRAFW
ncbi:MAG: proteasome subunit beta [Candidatus Marsarchaeota archaeon]